MAISERSSASAPLTTTLGGASTPRSSASESARAANAATTSREPRQVDRPGRLDATAALQALEVEQLLDHASGAGDALLEIGKRRGARFRLLGALGELHLQRERGHRRAQLVRRVGKERLLRIHRRGEPRKQRVQGIDERPQLRRHVVGGQRIEASGIALLHAPRGVLERRETAARDPGEHRTEHRDEKQHRHQHAQRQLARQRFAHRDRLADLHDAFGRDMRVDTPQLAEGFHLAEARVQRARRVERPRGHHGLEKQPAGLVVGAHHVEEVRARDAHRAGVLPVFAQVHGLGDLAKLVVEHPVELLVGIGIGEQHDHRRPGRERGDQPQHEVRADRSHSTWAMRYPTPRTLRITCGSSLRRR